MTPEEALHTARVATEQLAELRKMEEALVAHRLAAVRLLRESGWTLVALGDLLGMTHSAVSQMLSKAQKQ